MIRKLAIALCLAATPALALESNVAETDRTRASIVLGALAAPAGADIPAALRLKTAPGWHVYWRNPGDAGEPPQMDWSRDGAGDDLQFPPPQSIATGPLVSYGHEGDVLFPFTYTHADGGAVAEARWLVCADICVPESASLTIAPEMAEAVIADPVWSAEIAAAAAAVPQPAPASGGFALTEDGAALRFAWDGLAPGALRDLHFYPFENGVLSASAPQPAVVDGQALTLAVATGWRGFDGVDPLRGVLAATRADGTRFAVETTLNRSDDPGLIGAVAPLAAGQSGGGERGVSGPEISVITAVLLAVLGGLILNLMPCVFPILSLKAVGLAESAENGRARRHAIAYCAGALATFAALGAALAIAKAGGAAVGWGFQLQSPPIIAGLALLFFLIGLSLAGVFTVSLGRLAGGGEAGPALTGVLAVIATTPCTAPFMGAALGFAAGASAAEAMAVFIALGLGFILPFAAIAAVPGLAHRLPKPGRWMETLKQALAFPMFATVVWLTWVFATQIGVIGVAALGAAFVAAGLAAWAWGRFPGALAGRVTAAIAGAAALAFGVVGSGLSDPTALAQGEERWSPARVEALRAEGRPVFVEFTAAWCVTCLVNKETSLTSAAVEAAFAERDVAWLVGDWTAQDARIAAELQAHGRDGVPLYLLYAPDVPAAPEILPQILTPDLVLDALDRLDQSPDAPAADLVVSDQGV